MAKPVTTQLIRIGNSQGIRIPKLLIEQAGLVGDLLLDVHNGQLIVQPARHPRAGWDAEFARMAAAGDDELLDGDEYLPSDWDDQEWTW